jgi:hypothetical protein
MPRFTVPFDGREESRMISPMWPGIEPGTCRFWGGGGAPYLSFESLWLAHFLSEPLGVSCALAVTVISSKNHSSYSREMLFRKSNGLAFTPTVWASFLIAPSHSRISNHYLRLLSWFPSSATGFRHDLKTVRFFGRAALQMNALLPIVSIGFRTGERCPKLTQALGSILTFRWKIFLRRSH